MTLVAYLRYRRWMRPVSKLILVLASVSFLTITLSGCHLHADAVTHDEKAPHGHVHSFVAPPELDEDHIDISVFEPAAESSKGDPVALLPAHAEFDPIQQADHHSTAGRSYPPPQRHSRWRPELRGPPSST